MMNAQPMHNLGLSGSQVGKVSSGGRRLPRVWKVQGSKSRARAGM